MHSDLPAATRRHFSHYDHPEDLLARARDFVIARLLEEGDCDDLTWLTAMVDERSLIDWFETRGGRQLSRRSRAFWQVVLAIPCHPGVAPNEELWPL